VSLKPILSLALQHLFQTGCPAWAPPTRSEVDHWNCFATIAWTESFRASSLPTIRLGAPWQGVMGFYRPPEVSHSAILKNGWLEDYLRIGKVTFQRRTAKLWGGHHAFFWGPSAAPQLSTIHGGLKRLILENDSYSVQCHVSWSGLQNHATFRNAQVEQRFSGRKVAVYGFS